jgi:UDP-N-acetylmuramate dehydrogenase
MIGYQRRLSVTQAMLQELAQKFSLQENVDLSQLSSFRLGGRASYFFEATEQAQLIELLNALYESSIPYIILGGGSNCLFADDTYEGVVIKNKMNKICVQDNMLTAESGATIGEFNSVCKKAGLSGLEMLTRVPGTVGGVVWNNAGAFGKEASQMVIGGTVWSKGAVRKVDKDFFRFSYRHSILKDSRDYVLLEAVFELEPIGTEAMEKRMKEVLESRQAREPKGLTCGSFFRNPPDDFAGRLLEEVGAKGMKVGDIEVSQEHANWFLNKGHGTIRDLVALKEQLKQKVKDQFGIELHEEIDIIRNKK